MIKYKKLMIYLLQENITKVLFKFFYFFIFNLLLAWKKFKDYEKTFEQRSTIIQHIPKLHITETDIEQYFSSNSKPVKSSTIVIPSITTIDNNKQDFIDDSPITNKEQLRKKKVIETVRINKDDEELTN